MYIKVKYDIPINDFDVIPAGYELEIIPEWSDYEGFIAVKYRGGRLFFNKFYFEEVPALVQCV